MSFSIIAAIASNNIIGKNNKLPWYIKEDLEHFYKTTYGKPVIMGRKTYESMGKPIENSKNYVLSHNPSLKLQNCKIIHSTADALSLDDTEIMVIGGESVYSQFLPFVNKMYLTLIDHEFDGDAYFPKWKESEWKIIDEYRYESILYPYKIVTFNIAGIAAKQAYQIALQPLFE